MNGLPYFLVCGVLLSTLLAFSEATPSARIVGGTNTHVSKYPYQVSVRQKSCDFCAYEHYCGGVVYSSKIIITGANCVPETPVYRTMIVAGTSYRTDAARDGSMYLVSNVIRHENADVDILLLQLELELVLDGYTTKAATLATVTPRAGKIAYTAGWGQVEEAGAYSEELREVKVPIVDHETCQDYYKWTDITDYEICAGYAKGGSDACHGDAGSPLLVDDELVGIVSWGFGCARANNPGVYTNTVVLRDWIVSNASV